MIFFENLLLQFGLDYEYQNIYITLVIRKLQSCHKLR